MKVVPRFAAEPPHEGLPYGRLAGELAAQFLAACGRLESSGEELGEPGELLWYPERTWHGRTYVPATVLTNEGFELFGYVRYIASGQQGERGEMVATADFTEQTAERHPNWKLDICDESIGVWRGERSDATMTLVWGRALVPGGRVATAELGEETVDQCVLIEDRFTLIAPDDYEGELLEVRLFDGKGKLLASESLYEQED